MAVISVPTRRTHKLPMLYLTGIFTEMTNAYARMTTASSSPPYALLKGESTERTALNFTLRAAKHPQPGIARRARPVLQPPTVPRRSQLRCTSRGSADSRSDEGGIHWSKLRCQGGSTELWHLAPPAKCPRVTEARTLRSAEAGCGHCRNRASSRLQSRGHVPESTWPWCWQPPE